MKLTPLFEEIMSDVDLYMDIKYVLKDKYKNTKYLFHGTPRIDAITDVSDIAPVKNTVDSKYLYLTPYIDTAVTYSAVSTYKFSDKSGIIIFKIVSGKKYKFSANDISMSKTWSLFNDRLDELKRDGYDYVVGTQGKQEVIILNNNILKIVDKIYINKLVDELVK